jgi:hypothetical protein
MTKDEIKLALEAVLIGFKAERFMTDADYVLQDKAVLVLQNARAAQTAAIPDALTAHDHETPEYKAGWNDCRQLMMEILRKNNG